MPRPRALVFLLALCLLALVPAPALAQSGKTVTVKQRDADIAIQSNGDAQFVETWVVDFQRGSFTFAFREIPKNKLRDIVDWRVTEGDRTLETRLDDSDDNIKVTWYFPATNEGANFFSEVHTFTLRYTVRGAMRLYPNGDQWWWKFVEKDRAYPIESARVLVHLPAQFSPDQMRATTYTNGSDTGGGRILNGATIEYLGGPFPPQTEWEIRAQFPHFVQAEPEEWQKSDDRAAQTTAQNNLYAAIVGVIVLVGGPLLLLVLWYVLGRDKPTTVGSEFLNAPPDDTPPGVVGTLLDERADLQDIVATVADLAQRGYLSLREGDAFGTPEYERTAQSDASLAPFEKATLDALLRGMKMRRLDDVRGSFYYHLNDLQNALYDEVVRRGFFPASPLATRDLYFKIAKWGAVLVPTVGLCAYFFTFTVAPLALFPLLALELFFIGLLGLSRVMPQRTAAGATAFARWSAFKRYLAQVEKYTELNKAQDQFARYLPYAIAFGLEKTWIEKFSRGTAAPAPTWYIPYAPTPNDWSWSERGNTTTSSPSNPQSFPAARSATPGVPVFSRAAVSDNSNNGGSPSHAPSLNEIADNSFVTLNRVSSNMFDFLNTSAEAFTTRAPERSSVQSFTEGVGDVLHWIGTSGSSPSSSDSSSSSSSSWSDSGSSSSRSDSSSGGGGSGGGSSGFG